MSAAAISGGVRKNLAALQTVSAAIDAVQTRLSTGRRVNSAFDNPAAFFTSAALSSRAAALNQVMDEVADVKQVIDSANNGVAALRTLLNTAQTLANSALQSANTLVKVNGTNSTGLTTGTQIASIAGSATRFRAGDVVTVSDGTTTATYTAVNGDTVQTLLNAVNGTSNLKVTASLNSAGQVTFTATDTVNITIGATTAGTGTIGSVINHSVGATNFTANAIRTSYAAQFDAIRTQIDEVVNDSGYNGLNFLNGGTKTVKLNESGSSTMTLTGSNLSAAGLGLVASTSSFQRDSDISTALTNIGSALTALEAQTSTFSNNQTLLATRMDFNNSMISTLEAGADQLLATDTNADGATLLALQTRQQLAATTLSMSNNADQMALRLFGFG